MTARPAGYKDVPQGLLWLYKATETNGFDPAVLDYPLLKMVVAGNGKAVAYLPYHPVVCLESLGLRPDASARERLAAVAVAFEHVEREARAAGVREILFLSSDDRLDESAVAHFGFQRVTALRKRL